MSQDELVGVAPPLGTILDGKYRLVRELGAGAMGVLIEAEHLLLERPVAIKFLSRSSDENARRRVLREAQAARSLTNEHVVRVYDFGISDGAPYIVMERLEGTDLEARLADAGPLPLAQAAEYVIMACVGVAEAHAAEIVHRDIKPSNLFLTRSASGAPLLKVLDFGVAKVFEPPDAKPGAGELTGGGALLGSPYYMSPEQLRNPSRVDARTDVWSLAVTLFRLLTGDYPFRGATVNEVSAAVFTDAPLIASTLRAELPAALDAVIERALAKHPDERTASATELARQLAEFASPLGRAAAERLGASGTTAPVERTPRAASRSTELSRAPLVSDTHDATATESPQPEPAETRRGARSRATLALIGVGVFGGLVVWSLRAADAPPLAAGGVAPSIASGTSPTTVAASVSDQQNASAMAARSAPDAGPKPPAVSASHPRRSAAPPKPPSVPPKPSALKNPVRRRLDIDGVPIVE